MTVWAQTTIITSDDNDWGDENRAPAKRVDKFQESWNINCDWLKLYCESMWCTVLPAGNSISCKNRRVFKIGEPGLRKQIVEAHEQGQSDLHKEYTWMQENYEKKPPSERPMENLPG